MKAPVGALVSLYYDSPRTVAVGHVLKTPSSRFYLLVAVRRQTKGKHIGRWHLKAVVVEKPPEGAEIHPLFWYERKPRNEQR